MKKIIIIISLFILLTLTTNATASTTPYINNKHLFWFFKDNFTEYTSPLDLSINYYHFSRYNPPVTFKTTFNDVNDKKYFYFTNNTLIMNWQRNCDPYDYSASQVLMYKIPLPRDITVTITVRDLQGISPYYSQRMRLIFGWIRFVNGKMYGYGVVLDEGIDGDSNNDRDLYIIRYDGITYWGDYSSKGHKLKIRDLPFKYEDSTYHTIQINFRTLSATIDGEVLIKGVTDNTYNWMGYVFFGTWCKSDAQFKSIEIAPNIMLPPTVFKMRNIELR